MEIFLATTNPAKQEKLQWMLDGLGFTFSTPRKFIFMPPVPETGATHVENAENKARVWSARANAVAISSDGGLVIPALGERWEALHTARFAGQGATDMDRLDRLLELMSPHKGEQRAAYWIEALAIARKGRVLKSWRVESQPGLVAESYDPTTLKPGAWAFSLWYLPKLRKTYSQLSPAEIERLDDHWGRLRDQVRPFAKELV